jgi:hypothetical protein
MPDPWMRFGTPTLVRMGRFFAISQVVSRFTPPVPGSERLGTHDVGAPPQPSSSAKRVRGDAATSARVLALTRAKQTANLLQRP